MFKAPKQNSTLDLDKVRCSADLSGVDHDGKKLNNVVNEYLTIVLATDKLKLNKNDKRYWKCDEMESEFVEAKCEIEMLKAQNKILLSEIKKEEDYLKVTF